MNYQDMSLEDLIGTRINTLMWDGHKKQWAARVRGCSKFAHHEDVKQAVITALELDDDDL